MVAMVGNIWGDFCLMPCYEKMGDSNFISRTSSVPYRPGNLHDDKQGRK